MNKEIKEIRDEIKGLRHKRNSYYKLLRITNSFEKKIVKRQIEELSKYILSKKAEIRRIKTENLLDVIANQIERKIAIDMLYL